MTGGQVIVNGNATFINNRGIHGGAISLLSASQVCVCVCVRVCHSCLPSTKMSDICMYVYLLVQSCLQVIFNICCKNPPMMSSVICISFPNAVLCEER
jgi:hypothetical protein